MDADGTRAGYDLEMTEGTVRITLDPRELAAHPLRVGLFVAALMHLWPVASTTAFTSMPLGGWFFVLLGLGLAETRAYMCREREV